MSFEFPAVDGRMLDKQKLIKEGLIAPDCDYKTGAVGCALSHVNLWKKAADENRIITVFEDDAVATYRFQEKQPDSFRLCLKIGISSSGDTISIRFSSGWTWDFLKANLRFYDQRFRGMTSRRSRPSISRRSRSDSRIRIVQ